MHVPRAAAGALALALATVLLSAETVQPSESQERAALAAPVRLEATSHPALPEDTEDLWFVPKARDRRSRPSPVLRKFAEGVSEYDSGNFAAALPLVSARALASTDLADYATYYTGLTLLRLERVDEARQKLSSLKDRTLIGYLAEASVLARGEAAETDDDARAAADLYKDLAASKPSEPEVALYRLGRSLLAAGDRPGAAAAWLRLRYEFPLSVEASMA
jgi:hypothetical protein